MKNAIAIFLLTLSITALAALEVGGVQFDDKAKVGAGETVINGAGLRKKLFFKGYAIAIYLPQKAATTAELLAMKGAKRIRIVTLRELSAADFSASLESGIRNNHSETEVAPLNARIDALKATMLSIGNAAEGSVIHLDWLPDTGTRLSYNGAQKGADIAGEDFYRALLRIWLGDKPAQDDLKDKLLGKAS